MARLFDDAASQYLEVDTAAITSLPYTMACWFNSDDDATQAACLWIGDKDFGDRFHAILIRGTQVGDPIGLYRRDSLGASPVVNSTSGYTVGTCHHACAISVATNDATIYLDGGNSANDSTDVIVDTWDRTAIGGSRDSTPSLYMSGMVAEPAIWNVALTDSEVALAATGYPPPLIRPGHLVFYLPLDDTDREWNNRYAMTPVNGPGWAVHPPKVLRMKQRLWTYPIATMGNKLWAVS